MNLVTRPYINEMDRLVVELPSGSEQTYVALAFDEQTDGSVEGQTLVPRHGLPLLERHELVAVLCDDRAKRCVDDRLRVHSQPIRPEKYLRLWRAADARPTPLAELPTTRGLRLMVTLGGPLSALKRAKISTREPPYADFDGFVARHWEHLQRVGADDFRLELDCAADGAIRDALYFHELARKVPEPSGIVWHLHLMRDSQLTLL